MQPARDNSSQPAPLACCAGHQKGIHHMSAEEFETAMQNNDIAWLIAHAFLARVPELVAGGMSIAEAIVTAKAREDELCLMIIAPHGYWQEEAAKELQRQITEHVYHRLRAEPPGPEQINPKWVACEKDLGHTPHAWEFINWVAAQKAEK
jgi:hypothetical protein